MNWVLAAEEYDLYKNIDLPLPDNFYDDYFTSSSALGEQEMEIANPMKETDLKLVPPNYLNEEQRIAVGDTTELNATSSSNYLKKTINLWNLKKFLI